MKYKTVLQFYDIKYKEVNIVSDKNSPAIEQIITVLNNSPTAIYVSAIDNYELAVHKRKGQRHSREQLNRSGTNLL